MGESEQYIPRLLARKKIHFSDKLKFRIFFYGWIKNEPDFTGKKILSRNMT